MKKNITKTLIIALSIETLILVGLLGYLITTVPVDPNKGSAPSFPFINNIGKQANDPKKYEEYRQLFDENKQINEDYVGELTFDSGLISESFVQARSCFRRDGQMYRFYNEDGSLVTSPAGYNGNDVYIWTYWKTGEYDYNDHGGSVFMDYRNEIDDQNLIIYGHHFSEWNDETRQKAFTPLEKLLLEENYAENANVTMVLDHEIRHYVVACVYEFDVTDETYWDNCQYWRTQYDYDDYSGTADDSYFARYIDTMKQVWLYDTGVELTPEDKTLTLQTCISGHTGLIYEVVVLKLAETETY